MKEKTNMEKTNNSTHTCNYYEGATHRCFGQKGTPRTFCNGDTSNCEIEYDYSPAYETPYTQLKTNLLPKLKEYIKDYTRIYIKEDTLIVEFYHAGNLSTIYIESNLLHKLETGTTSSELALKIYKWYKSIILSRYFTK